MLCRVIRNAWVISLCLAPWIFTSCKSSEKKAATADSLLPLNVVLVTIDTLRADRLGCYGYSRIETPNLDGLARKGVLFENAVAQTPLTPPSHASMFTGTYPNVHKVRNTGGFVLQSSWTTMAEILQQQGWDTAAFIGASVLKKLFGFNQGFAVYDDEMPKPKDAALNREYPERPAASVVDRAVEWLRSQSGRPYFLWVHVYDPHIPYEPPAPFAKKYAGRPYDGEVAYTDEALGRLFDAVERKAPPGKTIVAVLSDHGESLGEHGEYSHGIFLYESTLRIPWIMTGPGVPAGLRVRQQARTIDLLPTVLDLMTGKPPASCQGSSLVPAFAGEEVSTASSYAETLYPKINMGWAELRSMRTNRWKYIRAPKPELYDLAADPDETNNVLERYPDEVRQLENRLNALSAVSEKVETSPVDERTMGQLKSLGYVSGFSLNDFELTGKGIDPKDRVEILKIIQLAVDSGSGLSSARLIALLRKAVERDPDNPSLYYHLGGEYEKAGKHDSARELYESALERGIRSGRLHSRIADLYLRQGKKAEAIAEYEKASQLNPSDVESQSNLAMAYLEMGRVADAERVYQWVVATGEDYAPAHNGLGLIAIRRQDIQSAKRHFENAARRDPDLAEAQLNLGLIYKMTGDIPRARACFEAFIAKAPPAQYAQIIPKVKAEIAALRQEAQD